jgi:hypothetical protein
MKKLVLILCVLLFTAANAFAGGTLTPENPISIDKAHKSISFLAEVNGKYLFQPTRHFAVFKDGKNGEKSVLRGFVNPVDFYEALLKIHAKAGGNMTLKNKETTHVKGPEFKVTVTWIGAKRPYGIDEVVNDSNHKLIHMKFGGNLENAKKLNTGCLLCLDSCPVGIVSNATYTYGAVEKRKEVAFTGNKDVLPPDGTRVVVTLSMK